MNKLEDEWIWLRAITDEDAMMDEDGVMDALTDEDGEMDALTDEGIRLGTMTDEDGEMDETVQPLGLLAWPVE